MINKYTSADSFFKENKKIIIKLENRVEHGVGCYYDLAEEFFFEKRKCWQNEIFKSSKRFRPL